MDVQIETTPATASVVMLTPLVGNRYLPTEALTTYRVVSIACPSISGHSISAVAPDNILEGGIALGVAA